MISKYNTNNNKREFFRINLSNPICGELTIKSVKEKRMQFGYLGICINNIGPGGLSFISPRLFPVTPEIIYVFKITMLKKIIYLRGVIVRCDNSKNTYSYGVKFTTDKNDESTVVKTFNTLAFALSKNPKQSGCDFCTENSGVCEKII